MSAPVDFRLAQVPVNRLPAGCVVEQRLDRHPPLRSSINGWKTIGNTRRKNGGASPPSVRSVTAYPTWQRVYDETEPGSAEKWKLALLECLTPGCPDSRYDA